MAKSYHERAEPSIDGYTKIPHDIMAALIRSPLSSYEVRAFLFIARMTRGWQKDSDLIALSTFEAKTGIERRNIHKVLTTLKKARLIIVQSNDRKAASYRINKNISEWRLSFIKATGKEERARRSAVLRTHDNVSRTHMTEMSCISTPPLSSISTPSKETLKEIVKKEKERESALGAGSSISDFKDSGSKTRQRDCKQEVEERKKLSEYRNKMAKSRLYSDDELASFKDKTLEELMAIDTARFMERNPHLGGGGEWGTAVTKCKERRMGCGN